MKITKDDLDTLFGNFEYVNLPTTLAMARYENHWCDLLDKLNDLGAQTTVWETTQVIALLFDTYPDQIKHVKVYFENESYDGQAHMFVHTYINDKECDISRRDLGQETNEACKRIDGAETLNWVIETIENQPNQRLTPVTHQIQKPLECVFTGSAQALEVGRQVAPEIQTWVNAKRLGAVAEHTRSKTQLNLEQVAGYEAAGAPAPKI